MAETSPPRRHAGTWIVIAILIAASLVGTLWVPFYARTTPTLGGFPFFYWYQILWVPIVAVLSLIAYGLARAAQRGAAASSDGPQAAGTGEGR